MSIQRLHAFEKTAIQVRHTLKRLEVLINNPRSSELEKDVARKLLSHFDTVRSAIPKEFLDVDIKPKE